MTNRHEELKHVEICQLHTEGEAPYANPEFRNSFHVNSFFIEKNVCNFFGLNFYIDSSKIGFNINYINSIICVTSKLRFWMRSTINVFQLLN